MPAIIVVGTQWGDEGKGRVVDNLAARAHLVARYNGGDNAGHTVIAAGQTLRLHLVPSGVLHPQALCLIGSGVVVNPARLISELDELAELGIDTGPGRVKLAATAHIILPSHRALDAARESIRGRDAIGTTMRGIGPTYADKAARTGLRAGAMESPESFAEAVAETVRVHNRLLEGQFSAEPLSPEDVAAEYCSYAQRLKPHLANGAALVNELLDADKTILCEGAQGTLLDLDHGTYPYVTSSSTIAGGALVGLGFGPRHVSRVIGVAKAYTTRVGEGPFPTELLDDTGATIQEAGGEYGTTTGRPRRCGWLDLTILRYAARLNGLSELALTKLDVLTGIDPLLVAGSYRRGHEQAHYLPTEYGAHGLRAWEPVYAEMEGWDDDLSVIRQRDDLPSAAQAYIAHIEQEVQIPISIIGVGPDRAEAIGEV